MSRSHCRAVLVAALLSVLLLVLAGPTPAGSVDELRRAGSADEPTGPLVAAVALAAWALAGWLVLAVTLTLLTRAPGRAGRAAATLTHRAVPPVLRRVVGTALGATAVAGTLLTTPAAAVPGPAPTPLGVAAVGASPPPVVFDLDWPEVEADPAPAPPPRGSPTDAIRSVPDAVRVRPGDTLWGLAEQALVERGSAESERAPTPAPTAAQVARAWPLWWSANREVVGDDPDLLLPGTVLHPPEDDDPPR